MLTDAMSHTVLLDIVLAFFVTDSLNSPLLIVGATIMGVVTVWCIQTVMDSKIIASDAAIGLIFPLFFSTAVLFIFKFAKNVHLDVDTVIWGELAFTPFQRTYIEGYDIGPVAFYTSAITLVIVAVCVYVFYKELLITSFDVVHATTLGIAPGLVYYGYMSLVSLTAVTSFGSVGSILVVSFMITPALSAALWTKHLGQRIFYSLGFAGVATVGGIVLSIWWDTAMAGMIAVVNGVVLAGSIICYKINSKT